MATLTAETALPFERRLREFFDARGSDIDALSAMFLLYRTNTDVNATMEAAALRPLGITHAGFVLLMTLWVFGPQETRQLARAQRVSRPSIVSSVDTLERAGLVRRVRSETDRRLVTVELTPDGAGKIELAQRAWNACEAEIASALTIDEQRAFAAMLRKLQVAAQHGCNVARSSGESQGAAG
jgi:DNA-binding MarR family transcriptional regulator